MRQRTTGRISRRRSIAWRGSSMRDFLQRIEPKRLLRCEPGHAALTILTIALGIGAVTTLVSVENGVLLSPLPWSTPIAWCVTETRGGRAGRMPDDLNGSYLAWADAPQTIEGIGTSGPRPW